MKRAILFCVVAAAAACAQAQAPRPADFSWRAELQAPSGASLVRVPLPAQALMHLQSPTAADLRVFDADGKPQAFAMSMPPAQAAPPRELTPDFPALPLFGAGAKPAKGAVQVRVQDGGEHRSIWVDLQPGSPEAPAARRLPSALFDTRGEKRALTALVVKADMGTNRPVRITASASDDLAQWTPVPLRGRLYRFEGEGAPSNDTLQFAQPLVPEGRYLRLEWAGEDGVTVHAVNGVIAPISPRPPRVASELAAPREDDKGIEWELPFATPIAAFELATERPNTLLPVRVLGRQRVSDPWRVLGHTVVWRLGSGEAESTNAPATIGRPSVRFLRVEPTHGMQLGGIPLKASVVFDPVQAVFVAGGHPPYTLVAGRAETPSAALPVGMLAAAWKDKIDSIPMATVASVAARDARGRSEFERQWLPEGVESRTAILWAVLGVGVLLLGAVAWSLLRQLSRGADDK